MTRRPRPTGRAVRRALRRRRRPLAALCTAVAVWATARAVAPPPPATTLLTVAARDLAAGVTLGPGDLTTVPVPVGAGPDGATAPAPGSVLAAPVRRGEPFTDVRLVGPGPARRPPGSVVVTVRTADPAAVLAVRPGDRVDVLAGPATDTPTGVPADVVAGAAAPTDATTLAQGLVVLAVPGAGPPDDGAADTGADGTGGLLGGVGTAPGATPTDTAGVLVVAADRAAAARLAAATGRSLTVVVVSP
ncbi:SAF domain-containing protein [Kineosporia sp. R_H_3]|uniref:SAF domain-containing protein n=1 Tax=Kineosporia sp. R_H_3 TaxID=1961848 RepID=UPI000B4A6CDB|nr:SAF domain-containing protein [Kineosporia sp. R_H_3]